MSVNNQVGEEEKPKSKKSLTEWRRDLVFEYITKGVAQNEIARRLQVDESTISKDVRYLREACRVSATKFFREELPFELHTTFNGFKLILRDVWQAADNTNDIGEKIQCYKLLMDVYTKSLDYVYTIDIAREGLSYVEDFKKKYKDRIMNALELEQKQRDQQRR